MAITDRESVLVLGAGVSAPFGLALGGSMIEQVSAALRREIARLHQSHDFLYQDFADKLSSAAKTAQGMRDFPIHGTVAKQFMDEETRQFDRSRLNPELNRLRELSALLDGQTSETIDDFIVENPSYAHLSKICIAAQFLESCCEFYDHELEVKPMAERTFNGKRNWIHLLINIVRQGIRAGTVSKEEKVQIITFNYDKILEFVLDKQFSNTEAGYSHYSDYINIIHVHGECGSLTDLKGPPADVCLKWAQGIHVVNESNIPADVAVKRTEASEIIRSARELYFCGFSFAGPNCRLLGIDSPNDNLDRRLISYCNYDGNVGISKSVQKYETGLKSQFIAAPDFVETTVEEATGTPENGLSVTDWLRLGYLGELPG